MRSNVVFATGLAVAGSLVRAPAQGRTLAPIPAPQELALPQLEVQSVWGWDGGADGNHGGSRPAFLFGDGVLQAVLGGGRACAPELRLLDGTGAARVEVELTVGGLAAPLRHPRIRRVRGTDVFLGEDADDQGVRLRTVSWISQGTLCQVFEVRNDGADPLADVRLSLTAHAGVGMWGVFGGNVEAPPAMWRCRLGELAAGKSSTQASMVLPGSGPNRTIAVAAVRPMLQSRLATVARWWQLELTADAPEVPDFVRDATASLLACHEKGVGPVDPASGTFGVRDATGPLLAYLRFAMTAPSREILMAEDAGARATGRIAGQVPVAVLRRTDLPVAPARGWNELQIEDPEAACWIVLHHYWHLRATQDAATIRAHWPLLEACVKRLPRQQEVLFPGAGGWSFASAVLFLHAAAALGSMQDVLDRIERPAAWSSGPPNPRPGAAMAQRALQLLAEVERLFWCEDRGEFAPWLAAADAAPVAATEATANLLPCWIGMLTTTGDKTTRNSKGALARLGRGGDPVAASTADPDPAPLAQAMAVVALTQFDGRERGPALARLLAMAGPAATFGAGGTIDLLTTGAAVDAALFALSGQRLATGPGIDEDWLRLKPELPPGARSLACRGLRHDGWVADLWADRVDGPLTEAERQANAALPREQQRDPDQNHRRTHFALVLRSPEPAAGHRLAVVHCEGAQFQDHLRKDQPVEHTVFAVPGPALLAGR